MRLRIHHFHHIDETQITRIERLITKELRNIMATLDELVAAAEAEDTKIDSLIAMMGKLKEKVSAAVGGALSPAQQAKVDAAFASISDNPDRIQAAIDANTEEAQPEPADEEPFNPSGNFSPSGN